MPKSFDSWFINFANARGYEREGRGGESGVDNLKLLYCCTCKREMVTISWSAFGVPGLTLTTCLFKPLFRARNGFMAGSKTTKRKLKISISTLSERQTAEDHRCRWGCDICHWGLVSWKRLAYHYNPCRCCKIHVKGPLFCIPFFFFWGS